jgi:Skp family chaperone for outer membrane proteins
MWRKTVLKKGRNESESCWWVPSYLPLLMLSLIFAQTEFEATQAELKDSEGVIESLRGEVEKAKKEAKKAKKALVQAQAEAEEQQKTVAKRKRQAEDVLDKTVTKKVKPLYISSRCILAYIRS